MTNVRQALTAGAAETETIDERRQQDFGIQDSGVDVRFATDKAPGQSAATCFKQPRMNSG